MKKISLLVIGIIAMFGVMLTVNAEAGVTLKCDKTEIAIGDTTNCYVTITNTTTVTSVDITLSTSKYLVISGITANSTAGWVANSANTSGTVYSFDNATGVTGASQVFSFNVTLSEAAKNLSAEDDCGQLCISAVTFNKGNPESVLEGTGTCFSPTVTQETCVGENCDPKNPETGAFMNYLIILGVGVVAIATILIIRRSSKFYRV